MKNITLIIYLTVPLVTFVLFTFQHNDFKHKEEIIHQQEKEAAKAEALAKEEEQKKLEEQLTAQAKDVARLKEEALKKREAEILAEKQKKLNQVKSSLANTTSEVIKLEEELKANEEKLTSERLKRSTLENDVVAATQQIERIEAQRAAAELEAQRLIQVATSTMQRKLDALTPVKPAAR